MPLDVFLCGPVVDVEEEEEEEEEEVCVLGLMLKA